MAADVLIVGAGPTGLTAALALAQRGIRATVIDKASKPVETSNALAVHARTLEVWAELGVVDDALAQGHRIRAANIATSKGTLGRIPLKDLPTQYPFVLGLSQHTTESILASHLACHGITVERERTLTGLVQTDSEVQATIDGHEMSFSWVLGCDGAESRVRHAIDVGFPGSDLPQHFIMADLTVDWDRPNDEVYAFLSDQGALAYIPLTSEGFGRMICDVSFDPVLKEEVHPAFNDFERLFIERCPFSGILRDPVWTSGFWVHSRLAERYRVGRVFLVGDAAHQHSPVGGQGMNTGIQDAYFLCDRLAKVIRHEASSELLDEYEQVRRPIGEDVVAETTRMTKVLTTRSRFLRTLRNWFIWVVLKIPALRHKIAMRLSELYTR